MIRLRAVGLDPACAESVHPERLRKLAREGGRFTAQHLRALSLPRRRATLVSTVMDTVARLLVRLGAALIAAKKEKADLDEAVTSAVDWDRLAASIVEAERLSRPEKADLNALAGRSWPVLHRLGPNFLAAFRFRAIPAGTPTLRAAEALRDIYSSGGRTWSDPTSPHLGDRHSSRAA